MRFDRIIFVTSIPEGGICGADGTGWLMELNFKDGSRLGISPFDLNDDGSFNDDDKQDYTDKDGKDQKEYASGKKYDTGLPAGKPAILNDPDKKKEYKYTQLSTGGKEITVENPGASSAGRQSWRQYK